MIGEEATALVTEKSVEPEDQGERKTVITTCDREEKVTGPPRADPVGGGTVEPNGGIEAPADVAVPTSTGDVAVNGLENHHDEACIVDTRPGVTLARTTSRGEEVDRLRMRMAFWQLLKDAGYEDW